jgi:hypothetical protein
MRTGADGMARFEVAAGINDEEGFQYNMPTFRKFFMDEHNLMLWVPAFALAVLLRVITHRVHHQLVFPICEFPIRYLCEVCW